MTITFPRDLPDLCAAVTGKTDLKRFQTLSLTGDGPDIGEIAPPIWRGEYSITASGRIGIAKLTAWVRSMRGGLGTFKGVPIRTEKLYRWPLSRPRGFAGLTVSGSPWGGLGSLTSIATQRDAVTIGGLPNGLVLNPGDFVSFAIGTKQHLFELTEGGTVASNSVTVSVEPTVRPDAVTGGNVRFEYPYCDMFIAGEVDEQQNKTLATVSFLAYQKPR